MTNIDQKYAATVATSRRIPAFAYLLCAAIGVVGSNSLALGPIAPAVARELGTGVPAVMTASAAFGLGTAASALLLARHIDRFGARWMLRVALAGLAAGLLVTALSPALAVLVAGQFVAGLAAGVALPAIYSLAAAVAPPGRESGTIGIVLTGWTLSMVAGVSLAALGADLVGWRSVYGVIAALAVVAALAVGAERGIRPSPGAAASPFAALGVPGVVPLLVACGAFMAAFYGVYAYIGDHLHGTLGLSLRANGLVAISYGLGFGGAALLDGIVDRFGSRKLLAPIFACVALVYVVMAAISGSFAALLATVFLWGLANHFGLNVLIMWLTALDPSQRGAIMGLNSGVTYLALFAGTVGLGALYDAWGFRPLPPAAALLMLVAAGAALLTRGRRASGGAHAEKILQGEERQDGSEQHADEDARRHGGALAERGVGEPPRQHQRGEEDAQGQRGRQLVGLTADQSPERCRQHEPGEDDRRPVARHDIMDEAVADADGAGDGGKRRDRQHPGADVDDRQPDHQEQAPGEAAVGACHLVGERRPAGKHRGRGPDDGEKRVPETVDRHVEQAHTVALADHHAPDAEQVPLNVLDRRHGGYPNQSSRKRR